MLVGADDGAIDHDPFTIRLTSKGFEDPLPDTAPVPPIEASEDLFQSSKDSGRSRQGAPVRCFQRMASTIGRLSMQGRPIPLCSLGSSGSSLAHIRSVRKVLAPYDLKVKPVRYRT